jgi:hypothetical protein
MTLPSVTEDFVSAPDFLRESCGAPPSGIVGSSAMVLNTEEGRFVVRVQGRQGAQAVWLALLGTGSGALPAIRIFLTEQSTFLPGRTAGAVARTWWPTDLPIQRLRHARATYGQSSERPGFLDRGGPRYSKPAFSVAEHVDLVRSALSLTTTHIAEIVGVSRPGIYAWIRGKVRPRKAGWTRLKGLAEVAKEWELYAQGSPVGVHLVTPLEGDQTLLSLLLAKRWNREAIEAALRNLAVLRIREEAGARQADQRSFDKALTSGKFSLPRGRATRAARQAEVRRLQHRSHR